MIFFHYFSPSLPLIFLLFFFSFLIHLSSFPSQFAHLSLLFSALLPCSPPLSCLSSCLLATSLLSLHPDQLFHFLLLPLSWPSLHFPIFLLSLITFSFSPLSAPFFSSHFLLLLVSSSFPLSLPSLPFSHSPLSFPSPSLFAFFVLSLSPFSFLYSPFFSFSSLSSFPVSLLSSICSFSFPSSPFLLLPVSSSRLFNLSSFISFLLSLCSSISLCFYFHLLLSFLPLFSVFPLLLYLLLFTFSSPCLFIPSLLLFFSFCPLFSLFLLHPHLFHFLRPLLFSLSLRFPFYLLLSFLPLLSLLSLSLLFLLYSLFIFSLSFLPISSLFPFSLLSLPFSLSPLLFISPSLFALFILLSLRFSFFSPSSLSPFHVPLLSSICSFSSSPFLLLSVSSPLSSFSSPSVLLFPSYLSLFDLLSLSVFFLSSPSFFLSILSLPPFSPLSVHFTFYLLLSFFFPSLRFALSNFFSLSSPSALLFPSSPFLYAFFAFQSLSVSLSIFFPFFFPSSFFLLSHSSFSPLSALFPFHLLLSFFFLFLLPLFSFSPFSLLPLHPHLFHSFLLRLSSLSWIFSLSLFLSVSFLFPFFLSLIPLPLLSLISPLFCLPFFPLSLFYYLFVYTLYCCYFMFNNIYYLQLNYRCCLSFILQSYLRMQK